MLFRSKSHTCHYCKTAWNPYESYYQIEFVPPESGEEKEPVTLCSECWDKQVPEGVYCEGFIEQ